MISVCKKENILEICFKVTSAVDIVYEDHGKRRAFELINNSLVSEQ